MKLNLETLKEEIKDVASSLENSELEQEVMDNVLERHENDPFDTYGEMYAYMDGLLQKY